MTPLDPERIEVGDAIGQRRSGAAWFRARSGRRVLQKSSCSRSTVIRCRRFHTTVRSSSLTAAAADTAFHDLWPCFSPT
ncbi:MAG TPA: hypothetical protein VN897_17350, partial [Mycobacterium sp.]|nr:hypothetical protein [Mycobacterium sp.]